MLGYRLIEKSEATVNGFLISFRKSQRHAFYAIAPTLLIAIGEKIFGGKPPVSVVLLVACFCSIKVVQWIYILWLGDTRCPQCGATPIVTDKLFGSGPAIGFGIPMFERQIKRCHKCDYPLSLAELEKDLIAHKDLNSRQTSPSE